MISKNTHVTKFLDFKSCFNQLFISKLNSHNFAVSTYFINNLFNKVIINQALIQCHVASHRKKLYLSLFSLNQNASHEILSFDIIFQYKSYQCICSSISLVIHL
jgi:hypothetical protein